MATSKKEEKKDSKKKTGSFFDAIKKMNEYAFVPTEKGLYDIENWCTTGIYGLNCIMSDADIFKGTIDGKRYVIAGENSTAKTLLSLQIIAEFLKQDKNNKVVHFETEGAILSQHMDEVGIDKNRIIFMPIAYIEEFRYQAVTVLDEYIERKKQGTEKGGLRIILDSLGMLSTMDENEKVVEDADTKSMTKPQLIASTFRLLAMRLAISKASLITIQHVQNKTGGKKLPSYIEEKKTISGGETFMYAGDVIIYLSKADEWEKETTTNDKGKETKSAIKVGIRATAEVMKSRFMKDKVRMPLTILYGVGVLPHSGLLQLAIEAGVFVLKGSMYENTVNGIKFYKKEIAERPNEIYCKDTMNIMRDFIQAKYSLFTKANDDEIKNFTADEESHAD